MLRYVAPAQVCGSCTDLAAALPLLSAAEAVQGRAVRQLVGREVHLRLLAGRGDHQLKRFLALRLRPELLQQLAHDGLAPGEALCCELLV